MTKDQVVERVRQAGVVGAGGGGFPTHIKLSARADTLIANGAECEPLSFCDRALMQACPREILDGIVAAAEAVEAKRAVLAIKRKYEDVQRVFRPYLASSRYRRIDLVLLDDIYPAGDEVVLTFDVVGRVVPQGGIPIDVGVVVQNVGTLFNVAMAFEGVSVTERMVSVCGAVPRPSVFRVAIGTPYVELIRAAGVTVVEGLVVLDGGVMMGKVVDPDDSFVSKMTTTLVVLPKDAPAVVERLSPIERVYRIARSVCDQCTFCTELCPRYLLGHNIRPHLLMRKVGYLRALPNEPLGEAHFCSECGLCSLYACPLGVSPRRVNMMLKERVVRPVMGEDGRGARPEVMDRRVPSSRLKARLGISEVAAQAVENRGYLSVDRVKIAMRQHTGEPARPVVRPGDSVGRGDVIARVSGERVGALIHSPFDGKVERVTAEAIVLVRQ